MSGRRPQPKWAERKKGIQGIPPSILRRYYEAAGVERPRYAALAGP